MPGNEVPRRIRRLRTDLQNGIELLNSALHDAEVAHEDSRALLRLQIHSQRAEERQRDFREAYRELLIAIEETDQEIDSAPDRALFTQFENMLIEVLACEQELRPAPLPELPPPMPQTSPAVRLPKISIPLFSGEFKAWEQFRNLYETLIHKNKHLSEIEKFQYLSSSLVGTAKQCISSFQLSADNYQLAYDALLAKYASPRKLAAHHLEFLLNSKLTSKKGALREMLNAYVEHIAMLKNLDLLVEGLSDFMLFHSLFGKLEISTRADFERTQVDSCAIPSFHALQKFLEKECDAQEMATVGAPILTPASRTVSAPHPQPHRRSPVFSATATTNRTSGHTQCPFCPASHPIYFCPRFRAFTPIERRQQIAAAARCFNCLGNHMVSQCPSQNRCGICGNTHHSMLHRPSLDGSSPSNHIQPSRAPHAPRYPLQRARPSPPAAENTSAPPPQVNPLPERQLNCCTAASLICSAVLPTALVEIADDDGHFHTVRALLDSGSMISFVTSKCAERLRIPINPTGVSITCIGGGSVKNATGSTHLSFRARNSRNLQTGEFVIVPKITSPLPSHPIPTLEDGQCEDLPLADPTWNVSGPIDVLFGANIYPHLLRPGGCRKFQNFSAYPTILGWVVTGSAPGTDVYAACCTTTSLDSSLKRFWEIEEVSQVIPPPEEDLQAEKQFQESVKRTEDGRFSVALPFKEFPPILGTSKQNSDRRLLHMERRLNHDSHLRTLYHDFMSNYLQEGHMSPLPDQAVPNDAYFIPHHGVFKTDEANKKIRVVFDASAKTSNGKSLNDVLLTGPKLQLEITNLLTSFRTYPIVFTCDIRQMFRQILIKPEHRKFQLIRWRFNEQQPIQTFQLNTVTYGTSCAPYLAMRTLHQLALVERSQFPLGAEALEQFTYVDDVLYSAPDIPTAKLAKEELIKITAAGGLELRKWSANNVDLLKDIPKEFCQTVPSEFHPVEDLATKILGLRWHASSDEFSFIVQPHIGPCTKRFILSEISRIYDPLGFLAPVTLLAKRFIQNLWTAGLSWDETPPEIIVTAWNRLKEELPQLSAVTIPRHLGITAPTEEIQLHGFCDASSSGYAAVIYLRTSCNNKVMIQLLIAKSRVAPLKRLSIPRLELQAAALLAELMTVAKGFFKENQYKINTFAWTDSMIALTWIRAPPHRWTTFVANRTAQIQEHIPPIQWFHVPTKENAADPASRGIFPGDIISLSLWWTGPKFLLQEAEKWPVQQPVTVVPNEVKDEEKVFTFHAQSSEPSFIDEFTQKFSSIHQLQKVFAYVKRFISNVRIKKDTQLRKTGPLSYQERHDALETIVKLIQHNVFSSEISKIQRNLSLPKEIMRLAPFLDKDGLLKVGGRVRHSNLQPSSKHPMLLPARHHITELLIRDLHLRYLHAGISTCQYLLLRNFWVISARYAIRRVLGHCTQCFRANPKSYAPIMADLPAARVSAAKPFSRTGVDFGGPIKITPSRHRRAKPQKAYICLFICFVTKALHIELVSDLTTSAFLAALRRFIARRGRCTEFYSDSATNFVGASRELRRLFRSAVITEEIQWKFNPPSAPHFGGLWEGNMRCVKMHLTRVLGEQILTYEEMSTLLCQIEAILNSRPLIPLSGDPNDLASLTPGHFLTTEALMSVPTPNAHIQSAAPTTCLHRWHLLQRIYSDFWRRWNLEFLHSLQQRSKWLTPGATPQIDHLVVIKDNNTPPMKWRLARIKELHYGADGIARVATVHTTQGTFRRPLVKLCPLPGQSPEVCEC